MKELVKARHPQHQGLLQGVSGPLTGTKIGTIQPSTLAWFANFHHSPVKIYIGKNRFECLGKESGGHVAGQGQEAEPTTGISLHMSLNLNLSLPKQGLR